MQTRMEQMTKENMDLHQFNHELESDNARLITELQSILNDTQIKD